MSKEDIDRIEKVLIEQEHRPIKVITNYLNRKKLYPDNNEKQMSTKKAIIWRLFFSPGVVATVGGAIALISLFVLMWQNRIMSDQNKLVADQNKWFQQQILSTELYSIKDAMLKEANSPTTNAQLLREYIVLQRNIDSLKGGDTTINITDLDLRGTFFINEKNLFRNVNFVNVDFRGSIFRSIDFSNTKFSGCNFSSIPSGYSNTVLEGQINALKITEIDNCKFQNYYLDGSCKAYGVVVRNTSFNGRSVMLRQKFKHSIFISCDFAGLDSINTNPIAKPYTNIIFINNLFLFGNKCSKRAIMHSKKSDSLEIKLLKFISDRNYSEEKTLDIIDKYQLKTNRFYEFKDKVYSRKDASFLNREEKEFLDMCEKFYLADDFSKLYSELCKFIL